MDKRGNATVPLLSLPHPDKTKLIFKDVLCSGFLVEAIVATGAGITVISPKFSQMLTNPIREWVGPGILLADVHKAIRRMMDVLLAGLKWNVCLVYLDDIVVFSNTVAEHLIRLEAIFRCLLRANLKLRLSKCSFLAKFLRVLGYIVSGSGLSPDPSKVAAVQSFPLPISLKQVQSFVGLCSYYHRFVRNFATIARPLTNLAKKRQPFIWEDEQQKSFDDLKTALTTPPILGHPNYDLPMEIHCDACDYGIGVVLIQRQDGEERVLD